LAPHVIVYTDGGSRGNPGPAAAAYVITDANGAGLGAKAFFLGQATNNIAEYTAFIKALDAALNAGAESVTAFSDSELLVGQINGQYRVKSPNIKPLHQRSIELLNKFLEYQVKHIPREANRQADDLVNRAINLQKNVEEKAAMQEEKGRYLRLGVLISGGGRTLINIHDQIKAGRLNAEVAVIISSRSTVAGVEKAKAAGLDVKIVRKKDLPDIDSFSEKIEQQLVAAGVDLVIQAGWLCFWKIPQRYTNRVMNIHPALLPSFGGQGMWGRHVHEAVLKAGCKVSGCTVHLCTNEYDKGPIIVQRCCRVKPDDDPDTLAARVFQQECIAYPEAISLFAQGRISVENGIAKIK